MERRRARLAFDELLSLQLAVLSRRREQQHEVKGVSIVPPSGVIGGFLDNLPFPLTAAQRRCVKEIAGDLKRGTPPMNRLLQGEVGSGKTVVALAAMLSAAASGHQAAMMAPTELLAEQHFQSVAQLLGGLPPAGAERSPADRVPWRNWTHQCASGCSPGAPGPPPAGK